MVCGVGGWSTEPPPPAYPMCIVFVSLRVAVPAPPRRVHLCKSWEMCAVLYKFRVEDGRERATPLALVRLERRGTTFSTLRGLESELGLTLSKNKSRTNTKLKGQSCGCGMSFMRHM